MIERHITFDVHPDRTADFERFFAESYRPPVLEMPGLIECSLLREMEQPTRYQMIFRWEQYASSMVPPTASGIVGRAARQSAR